ncbi:hypothetical protein GUITHDRAFT_158223 [Guillardia theta CCMP2712]|uniref:Uncharacterized protein n=1 Tax=Guillardia theta (strain CCMP2712) TaxID=905079 RepID=L1IZV7_GUITC|nr:hypothetical protein GUITHDRAFT_158223 [Guillardia theta CCMP2712]EKX41350.1 hypothetical protein GUITHDRAFT_158223 [Guillardia theta CCMP2712]|eukprot:XP_005828330.1 hypothetical protein GUITHDRAFT_158223 [Guillardia theta CCMP2712]
MRVFDGKRGRKQPKRKCVDFNSSSLAHLHSRVLFRDYRDLQDIQPSLAYDKKLRPAYSCHENPASCVTTKLADTSVNKNNAYSHRCPVFAIAWTPEGRGLVAGNSQGEFTLWDGYEFNFLTIWQGHDQSVQSMTWSHNGEFMVSADKTGLIKYWMNNMNEVKKFQGHKDSIRSISFSPSDLKFVTGGDDCVLKIWDFETGTEERAITGHHWDVKCCHWHPYKPLILSGGKDHKVKLWDARSGSCLDTIHAHKNTVRACEWSSNGNWFFTGGRDQKVKLYDLRRTNEAVLTFNGHKNEVTSLAVHPFYETLFVTGDYSGSILYWSTNSDEPIAARQSGEQGAHEACIWSLAWHPLGHILCSGANDHTCKFWCRNRPGEGTIAACLEGGTMARLMARGGWAATDKEWR